MTTYKLVAAADSFFIVDVREECLTDTKYPSAYVQGASSRTETNADGWKRTMREPVIGAQEFAERLVAALNAGNVHLSEDDSAHLPVAPKHHQEMLDAMTAADEAAE